MVLLKPSREALSYQTAIIGTLKLLRMGGDVARTVGYLLSSEDRLIIRSGKISAGR